MVKAWHRLSLLLALALLPLGNLSAKELGDYQLGDKAEEAFRQSLLGSQGGLGIFFSNGLVGSIMVLGLIALFWPLISRALTRARPAAAA